MSLKNVITINADIKNKNIYFDEPTIIQNDNVRFIIVILDGGKALSQGQFDKIEKVTLANTRLDKVTIVTMGELLGEHQIVFDIGNKETEVPGRVKAMVQLYDANGRVSALSFSYTVAADPTGDGFLPSEREKTLIESVLADGPLAIEQAVAATVYANEQGDFAKAEAEKISSEMDNLATLKKTIDTKITEATSASTGANAAKTNAEKEAANAKTQADRAKAEADRLMGTDVSVLDNKITETNRQLAETAQKPYNYLYNIDNGLRKWRLAKARLDAGVQEIINLNILGDSITEGQAGGTVSIINYQRGYVNLLRNQLIAKYGDVGEGMIANQYPYTASVTKWTYTGTWVGFGMNGLVYGTSGTKVTTTIGSTASLTFNGTGVVILAESQDQSSTPNVSISVDGGAPQTWNTYNGTAAVKSFPITGLTNAQHTVVITSTTTSKFSLLGAYEIKGTKGVRVNNFGVSGLKVNSVARPFNAEACVGYWNPKLTIISFLANDFNTQTDLNAFKADWQAIITKAKQYGDVLITTAGGIFNANHPIPVSEYYNVVLQLAKDNGCALIDIKKRWGDTFDVANNAGYLVDNVHPNPEGHQDLCNVYSKVMLELI
ncbi:GDSL-type esterase/lipase family protein [Peribacillus loiseleuriae]|uniref:GDSL-type esterase/lipase family protein n=1 Tax=Peribacillus loiseleuriae TaxID=1679170 RepID=UPI00381CDBAA